MFWFVFGLGLLLSQYTITGFDASAHLAEETHQASRMAAVGMYMSVVVSVVFGWILLLAVTFAIPSTQGGARQRRDDRAMDLDGVDEPELGRDPALHLRRGAVVLPDGVRDVGVADDVRVLPRRRGARTQGLAEGRRATASRATPSVAIVRAVRALMVPAYWNASSATRPAPPIAVIGLYIAFVLPVYPPLPDAATSS